MSERIVVKQRAADVCHVVEKAIYIRWASPLKVHAVDPSDRFAQTSNFHAVCFFSDINNQII
jgi:hypothetical protein